MKDRFPNFKNGYRVVRKNFYRTLGGVSGGTIGFITNNIPGAVIGSKLGYELGKIKDEYDEKKRNEKEI